jgi:hypothetical protein
LSSIVQCSVFLLGVDGCHFVHIIQFSHVQFEQERPPVKIATHSGHVLGDRRPK